MPRPIPSNPLALASPTLQPTAQPIATQIGATPPPRSSGLMDLANAFASVNPELRDGLRDAAAREDNDAMALGELEATKARAAGRMAELDTILKKKVDSGELPWARLPAAQRGASIRAGQEAAEIGLQTELLKTLPDAIKADPKDVEASVGDIYTKFREQIRPDDFYAQVGFNKAAQNVIAGFRQRVAEGQSAEFERQAKQQLADDGTERLHQLASADADATPVIKDGVKQFLDQARRELPKSQVNAFFGENMLKPAVDRLVQEGKYSQARQLVEEVKSLDLTGKGGLFGKTEDGGKTILQLSTLIEERDRASTSEQYRLKAAQEEDAPLRPPWCST